MKEQTRRSVDTRSLRAPGWLDKPGALRSLDVCLDSRGPFIDAVSAISALNESLRLCQLCALCRRLRLLTFLAEA